MTKFAGRSATFDFDGTPIGQLRSVGAFGSSRNQIDASVYGEEWTSFVLGLQDGDEMQLVAAHDPADSGQAAIATAYDTAPDTPATLTITHVDSGAAWDVTVIVAAVSYETALDGLLTQNATLKIVNPGVVAS
jgi:hypothetical protein